MSGIRNQRGFILREDICQPILEQNPIPSLTLPLKGRELFHLEGRGLRILLRFFAPSRENFFALFAVKSFSGF
jgi:hypothetical protein